MIEVGQIRKDIPVTFGESEGAVGMTSNKLIKGTVVYVHPEGRYYTSDFGRGCRESFIITDLEERARICVRSRKKDEHGKKKKS